jgi:predicted transcriptional regulator
VGIASYEDMKARTMAVARGEHRIAPDEPKVWFTSTESLAKVLSAGNRDLLRVIVEQAPGSLDELARITGKAKSNLSRLTPPILTWLQVEFWSALQQR